MELFGFLSFSKRFVKDILFVICSDIIKIIITCLNMGKKYIYFQSHLEHNHDQRMLSEIFVASKNVTCWWRPRASIRHPCSGSWAHPPHLAPWCPLVSRGSCRSLTTAISSEGGAYPLHQRLRTGHSNVLRKELQHLRILTTGAAAEVSPLWKLPFQIWEVAEPIGLSAECSECEGWWAGEKMKCR